MRFVAATIRAIAIMMGVFWVVSSILDILGLVQYSQAPPPLAQRVAHSIPSVSAGVILLLPYRFVQDGRIRIWAQYALCLVIAWVLYLTADTVSGYFSGQKSWHAVPAAILLLGVTVGNLWVFLSITRGNEAPAYVSSTPGPGRTERTE